MENVKDEEISLLALYLDSENPRHDIIGSQPEIIDWMLSDESSGIGKKILALAKDIAEHGVNPAERAIVVRHETEKNAYVVLEGNRRVTALKLLKNPALARDNGWKEKFSSIIERSELLPNIKIKCVVFPDRESASHFVELKHMGEQGGIGTVAWGAVEKGRHDQRLNRRSRSFRSLMLIDYIKKSPLFNQDVKDYLDSTFPITTLDRLLSSPDFREFLGLTDVKDGVGFSIDPVEAVKPISKLIVDFGSKRKKVDSVINSEKRSKYKDEFKRRDLPDYSKRLESPVPIDSERLAPAPKAKRAGPNFQNPNNRKTLVFKGENLPINPRRYPRIKKVFDELRVLEVQGASSFPNAAAVLFRSFLEMSTSAYIDEFELSCPSPRGWVDISLNEKLKKVIEHLKSERGWQKRFYNSLEKALGSPRAQGHTDALNGYVHNYSYALNAKDLLSVWETYAPYFQQLWSALNEKK